MKSEILLTVLGLSKPYPKRIEIESSMIPFRGKSVAQSRRSGNGAARGYLEGGLIRSFGTARIKAF